MRVFARFYKIQKAIYKRQRERRYACKHTHAHTVCQGPEPRYGPGARVAALSATKGQRWGRSRSWRSRRSTRNTTEGAEPQRKPWHERVAVSFHLRRWWAAAPLGSLDRRSTMSNPAPVAWPGLLPAPPHSCQYVNESSSLSAYKFGALADWFCFFIIIAFYRQFYELTKVVLPGRSWEQSATSPDNADTRRDTHISGLRCSVPPQPIRIAWIINHTCRARGKRNGAASGPNGSEYTCCSTPPPSLSLSLPLPLAYNAY